LKIPHLNVRLIIIIKLDQKFDSIIILLIIQLILLDLLFINHFFYFLSLISCWLIFPLLFMLQILILIFHLNLFENLNQKFIYLSLRFFDLIHLIIIAWILIHFKFIHIYLTFHSIFITILLPKNLYFIRYLIIMSLIYLFLIRLLKFIN
jgi:hypothetical protein